MNPLSNVLYQTLDEIEAAIKEREAVAVMLPPGMSRHRSWWMSPGFGRTPK